MVVRKLEVSSDMNPSSQKRSFTAENVRFAKFCASELHDRRQSRQDKLLEQTGPIKAESLVGVICPCGRLKVNSNTLDRFIYRDRFDVNFSGPRSLLVSERQKHLTEHGVRPLAAHRATDRKQASFTEFVAQTSSNDIHRTTPSLSCQASLAPSFSFLSIFGKRA